MLGRVARSLLFPALAALALGGCRQNDDPEGARELYARVNEGAGFRAWQRAPGFPERKPSFTAHSNAVEIYVNDVVAEALAGPVRIAAWPTGSIIVKEGFRSVRGDARAIVAIMEKREDGWYWVETDGEGEPLFSGRPTVCVDCHDNRASYSDWVYSFELPR